MASAELLTALVVAAVSYAVVPGPGTVYVAAQAMMRDPRAAIRGAVGLHVGGYVIVIASAAGLTVLFNAVPVIYQGLKLLGAGYLVWLGIRMIFLRPGAEEVDRLRRSGKRQPRTFSQGVLVEMLNPTTVVFYVAFLPQFIDPAGGLPVWVQFVVFGVLINWIFSLGDVVAIVIALKMKSRVAAGALGQRVVRWIGGSVLVGLGLRLAADRG